MSATVTKITPPPPTVLPDVQLVSVEKLYPSKDNPRSDLGDIEELTASIRSIGVLQPIRVVTNTEGGGYIIVSGHRRHAAAVAAGAVEVPVLIEALEEEDRVTVQLVENLHREDLSPLDKAAGFQQLVELGNSQGAIAKLVGVSQGTVSKHLALLKLPDKGQELVASGVITQEQGVALAGLPEADQARVLDGDPQDAAYWIDDLLEEEKVRQETAAELAVLKAAGVPIIEYGDISTKATVGPVYLHQLYWVQPAKHKKADCRAIGVREDGLSIIELCTTPKNHPQPKSTTQKMGRKESDEAKAKREETERLSVLLNEASERRRQWIRSFDTSRSAATLQAVVGMAMVEAGYDRGADIATVMDWLGVARSLTEFDRAEGVKALAAWPSSEREFLRLAFLLAASAFEEEFDPETVWRGFQGDEAVCQGYLEQLVQLGYELSWIEQKWAGLPFEEPAAEAEPGPSGEPDSVEAPTIEVYEAKAGRWQRRCSECGDLPGFNTKEDVANGRAQDHLVEEHELEPAPS